MSPVASPLETLLARSIAAATSYGSRQFALVTTFDAPSVMRRVTSLVGGGRFPLRRFLVGNPDGWSAVDPRNGSWRTPSSTGDPGQTLAALDSFGDEPSLFVLFGMEAWLDQPHVQSALWRLHLSAAEVPHVVVLVGSPSLGRSLPEALRTVWNHLEDPLPAREDFDGVIAGATGDGCPTEVREHLRGALAGFTWSSGESTLQRAVAEGRDWDRVVSEVDTAKRRLLSSSLQMDILSPPETPVHGLDLLKSWVAGFERSICVPGKDRIRGILLVGPPGVGKTLVAQEVGRRTGQPVVDFRIGSLMEGLVGATENNILRATRTIDRLAPCVVFLDEIEKALAGGASTQRNDGGVMARVHGTLLSWLNDSTAPMFVIGTANHIDRVEDWRTLFRRGRFDAHFFIDVPGPETRRRILTGDLPDQEPGFYDAATERTPGFTGADLAHVARQARLRARSTGIDAAELAMQEISAMQRGVERALAEFEALRREARANCRPASSDEPEV